MTQGAVYDMYTHTDGTKCIWLEDHWFVPLDAGGEGYACPHAHAGVPEGDVQYAIFIVMPGRGELMVGEIFTEKEVALERAQDRTEMRARETAARANGKYPVKPARYVVKSRVNYNTGWKEV